MKCRLPYFIVSILIAISGTTLAQTRPIPDNAKRGWLKHVQERVIAIDDQSLFLAPGGIIRNKKNLIVMPASLPPDGALADYQLDTSGQVTRAWLLTPDEAAREKPQP